MGGGSDRPLSIAVLIVGAAAGLAVLVSGIGAVVSWGRFYSLDLPSHAASATLSQSTLLLTGVNATAGAFLAGLGTVGLSILLRKLLLDPQVRQRWKSRWKPPVACGLCALALTLISAVFVNGPIALYVGCAGLLVAWSLTPWGQNWSPQNLASTIFGLMFAVGIFLLVWGIVRPPTHLERAELTFSNGRAPVWGFWIAETASTVYIATQEGGRYGPCQVNGEVLAFPRDDVAMIRFESPVAVWSQDRTPTPGPCG